MSTIDKLNNDILELRNENDYKMKKVIKLLLNIKQMTEHLTAEQERLADEKIKFVRTMIHFNNQIIREKEKQIREIEKQIILNNQIIRYKEKQIAADKEKDAANAKFRAERGETSLIMSTIDKLNSNRGMLEGENNVYKEQLTTLHLKQSTEHVTAEQERLDDEIKLVRISIGENNKKFSEINQIILHKERQIAADKEKDAADAKFRAERGETNSSPMLVIFFPW